VTAGKKGPNVSHNRFDTVPVGGEKGRRARIKKNNPGASKGGRQETFKGGENNYWSKRQLKTCRRQVSKNLLSRREKRNEGIQEGGEER